MKYVGPQIPNGGQFNVKEYGAKGDGSVDDSAAVTACVDAASAYAVANGTGATVIYPPGKYRQDSTIRVKPNLTFVCYGAYIYNGGTYIAPASEMFDTAETAGGYSGGCDNVIILGGIFDAKGQSCPTSTGSEDEYHKNVFTISTCRNWRVEDATFRNVPSWHALDFNSVDGVSVINCRFEGFVDKTLSGSGRSFSEAIQLDRGPTPYAPTINVTVSNCYMGAALDGSGLGAFGKLVGTHTNTAGQKYTNIRVIGNYIDDSLDNGIQGYCWEDSVIQNNIIKSAGGYGILLTQSVDNVTSGISVDGNVIEGYASRGIGFQGDAGTDTYNASRTFFGCSITNNILRAPSASLQAIYTNGFVAGEISGNCIVESGDHGLLIDDNSDDTAITFNTLNVIDNIGIQFDSTDRAVCFGNYLHEIQGRGIWIANSSQRNSVHGNYIVGANRAGTANIPALAFSGSSNSDNSVCCNSIKKFGDGGNEAVSPVRFEGVTSPQGNAVIFNHFEGWSTTHGPSGTTPNITLSSGTTPPTGTTFDYDGTNGNACTA